MSLVAPPPRHVTALQDLGQMGHGQSGARVVRCDDNQEYVAKLPFPPWPRMLPNELLGAELGRAMICPMPEHAVIHLPQAFLDVSPAIKARCPHPCTVFGTVRLDAAVDIVDCRTRGVVPEQLDFENEGDLPRAVAFDNWVQNGDRDNEGNNLLVRVSHSPVKWKYYMMDHSHVLGGPNWTPAVLQLEAVRTDFQPCPGFIRDRITGPEPFNPALALIEAMPESTLRAATDMLPDDWGVTQTDRDAVISFLARRRPLARSILEAARGRFPKLWRF